MTATTPRPPGDQIRSALLAAGRRQRALCLQSGSPTYAAIISALDEQVRRSEGPGCQLLATDPSAEDAAMRTALHLRLIAAAGRVARRHEHPLTRCYPTLGGRLDPQAAVPAFLALLGELTDEVRTEMRRGLQTNEPRRSAPLAAAFAHVAKVARMPVQLNEIGASAGLNLSLDRYRIEVDDTQGWGPAGSPVRLTGSFRSGTPPTTPFLVVGRAGCDLEPQDLRDEASRRLLESFIWPEHVERMALLRAAVGCAEHGLVERGDAVTWARDRLSRSTSGQVTALFHTVVATYFDDSTTAQLDEVVDDALNAATPQAPVARVSMEPETGTGRMVVTAAVAPFHGARVLARCAPHGQQIDWIG